MAIQGPTDLKEITDEVALKNLLQSINDSHLQEVTFENMNYLSPELQEQLLIELENNPTLFKITLDSEQFEKRIRDLENRNKLLNLYGIQKVPSQNYWHAAVEAHLYNDMDTGGRCRIFKRMQKQDDTAFQMSAMTELGATWHRQLFSYLQSNQERFEAIGFPYRQFIGGMMADVPYYPIEQFKAIHDHLSLDDPYMPFRQVTIEYTRLEEGELDGTYASQIVKLIEKNTERGSPIEEIKLDYKGASETDENNLTQVKGTIDALLALVKQRNEEADVSPIRTQLTIIGVNLDDDYKLKLKELQNLVAINVRNHQKEIRQQGGHVKREARAPVRQAIRSGKIDPSQIRQCKRDPKLILAGLDQQQQEQQQMQMMQQRQALLDQLKSRKGGLGDLEVADSKSYLTFADLNRNYGNNRTVAMAGDPSIVLEERWVNLTGGTGAFHNKIMGISKNVAELLIAFPSTLSEGFSPHNLPPGFSIKRSNLNSEHLLLDYDPVRAKLDIRNKNDLQLKFLPRGELAQQTLPGDERQFNLSAEDYQAITRVSDPDIDVSRSLILDQLPAEIVNEYSNEFAKLNQGKLLMILVDCIENKSIEDMIEILKKIRIDSNFVKELVNEPIGINQTKYKKFIEKLVVAKKVEIFYQLIANEDAILGPIIKEQYADLFKLFNSDVALVGFSYVVVKEGALGIKILLDKLDAIRKNHGDEQLKDMIKLFVGDNVNSSARLLQTEELKALDYIASLSKGQFAWWLALTKQHAKNDATMDIVDLASGFKTFVDKLAQINPALQLTDPCPIINSKNLKTTLDKVWFILNNAVDPKEQLDHLEGLSLGQIDAYLAMQEYDYFLVTPEMDLKAFGPFMSSKALLSLDPSENAREPYEVHLNEFTHVNSDDIDYQDCKTQYFRLLGKQPFLDQFDKYKAVVALIDQRYQLQQSDTFELPDGFVDINAAFDKAGKDVNKFKNEFAKAAAVLGEKRKGQQAGDPKVALALVAYATTHKEALGTIDKNVIDKLFAELNKIEQLSKQHKKNLYQSLLSHLNLGGDPPQTPAIINPPTMAQLTSLVRFHHDLGAAHTFNKSEIEYALSMSGANFYSIIEELEKSRDKQLPVLTSDNIASVLKELATDPILSKDEHKNVRELLLKTFAKLNNDQFNAVLLKKFIATCGQYASLDNDKNKLISMLELINSIDTLHQNTTALPSIIELSQALEVTVPQPEDNAAVLIRQLSTMPGFEHCYFGNQKVEEFDPDSIKNFLKEAEAEIRAQLGGFIDFEDKDFTDPVLFIQKLKNFEDRIPSVILNPLISKAFNMVKASNDALIIQHLEEQLFMGEDKMRNTVAALFKDKLAPLLKPDDLTGLLTLSETMSNRLEVVDKLIVTLQAIKHRSATDYEQLVTLLNASPGVSQVPIALLNEMLEQMNRFHKGKLPIDLISVVVSNPNVNKSLVPNWNDTQRWLMPLIREKRVPVSDLKAIIELQLNLSAKKVNVDGVIKLSDFFVKQEDFRKDFIKIFSDMEANPEFADQYGQMITNTLSVIAYLDTQKNSHELKSNFIKAFKNAPHLYAEAIKQITKSAKDDEGKAHLVMILSRMNEGKTVAELDEASERKKHESKEQRATRMAQEVKELGDLVTALAGKNVLFNQSLANVDPDLGFPSVQDIISYQQDTIDDLLKTMIEKRKIARDAILDEQFDTSQVSRVLEDMQNLATDTPLQYAQRQRMQQDFFFINAIGHSHKISTRPDEVDKKPAIIKDMSKQEIQYLINYYQKLVRDPGSTEEAKHQGRLIYLALLRESMYRTTGCLPFSTQILCVLNAMELKGNNISEVITGQGKTLISGLMTAMQHLEVETLDVCTANMFLAREGLAENKKFFQYLGVKHGVIDSSSDLNDYAIGGINYSEVAQLALFRSRSLIEGGKQPTSVSLILDEADYTILDDSTAYRYAVNLDNVGDPFYNPFDFAYKLVNEFINTDEFKNPNATIQDDKVNLRKYLIAHAKGAQKDLVRDPESLSDKQLDIWIDSAASARELYKLRDKRWTLREEIRGEQKVSVARLIINDRISDDAQWTNGVQQMLHALINEEDVVKNGNIAACTLDPEISAVASVTSKNFLDYYNKKNGVVWGMTGTIGSDKEKREHQEKYGFKLTAIPSHQKQRRIDHKPILVETDALHQEKIFKEVLKRIRKNDKMPSLIICKDATTSKALAAYIDSELRKLKKNHPLTLQLYNGINNERVDYIAGKANKSDIKDEKDATSQAGLQGTITISTPMFGRGTDFKPRKMTKEGLEVKHPFGLFVVQSYLDSERTSRQVVGRGGRQGWFGESMTIISKEALRHDLAASEMSDAQITQRLLEERIEDVRTYRNYTAKQQRTFSESYGDVRNHYFAKLIEILDKIPEVCEEQQRKLDEELLKPVEDRDESIVVPDAAKLRKKVLKDWEQFLNNLDSEWKVKLNQPVKPELIDAVASIARHAATQWNMMVASPQHQIIGKYHVDEGESVKMMTEVLDKPLVQAAIASNDPYRRLPETINIHKAYCDNMQKIDAIDRNSFIAAYHTEIDGAFQKLKSIISHEKPPSVKWSKSWDKMSDYNAKFRILNEVLMQADLKCRKVVSQGRYHSLQNEVMTMITWAEKFPEFSKDTNQLKQMLLQAHLNHRKALNKSEPEVLLAHDRDMQLYANKGFYPSTRDYDNLMKRSTAAWHRVKDDSLLSLQKYQKAFFTSRTRKAQTNKLMQYLAKTNDYDVKGMYQVLLEARKFAHQDDAKSSLKKKLFNNKLDFGSRFHKMLNGIQERMIANVNKKEDLQEIYQHEKQDLRLLLNAIDAKYVKNEVVRAAVQNIKIQLLTLASPAELQKSLMDLSQQLGTEKRLKAAVLNKLTHLSEIDIRLERLTLLEPAPEVQAPIHELPSKLDASLSSVLTSRVELSSETDALDLLDTLFSDDDLELEHKEEIAPVNTVTEISPVEPPPQEVPPIRRKLPLLPTKANQQSVATPMQSSIDIIVDGIRKADVIPAHEKLRDGMLRVLASLGRRAASKQLSAEQNQRQMKETLEGYTKDSSIPKEIQALAKQALAKLATTDGKVIGQRSLRSSVRESNKENISENTPKAPNEKQGPKA